MPASASVILDRIITYVFNPILTVIFTLGLFLFFYGIIEFLWASREGKPSETGKQHMLWGLFGMLIMVSVYGIIQLIMNTLGIDYATATDASRINNALPSPGFLSK